MCAIRKRLLCLLLLFPPPLRTTQERSEKKIFFIFFSFPFCCFVPPSLLVIVLRLGKAEKWTNFKSYFTELWINSELFSGGKACVSSFARMNLYAVTISWLIVARTHMVFMCAGPNKSWILFFASRRVMQCRLQFCLQMNLSRPALECWLHRKRLLFISVAQIKTNINYILLTRTEIRFFGFNFRFFSQLLKLSCFFSNAFPLVDDVFLITSLAETIQWWCRNNSQMQE